MLVRPEAYVLAANQRPVPLKIVSQRRRCATRPGLVVVVRQCFVSRASHDGHSSFLEKQDRPSDDKAFSFCLQAFSELTPGQSPVENVEETNRFPASDRRCGLSGSQARLRRYALRRQRPSEDQMLTCLASCPSGLRRE
jgi:hypothetical protein